ncbi:MAG: Hypoxia induced protein conserved region [Rickettsiales bacterium]|jgi:type II secretory pathway pseudopilin PulG|nr:Hypoxia induced protein conserved region [Rickettsiales bacterium]
MQILPILLVILMIATLGVLGAGLITMARDGQKQRERSNRLMVARVVLQGLAVLIVLAIAVFSHK